MNGLWFKKRRAWSLSRSVQHIMVCAGNTDVRCPFGRQWRYILELKTLTQTLEPGIFSYSL